MCSPLNSLAVKNETPKNSQLDEKSWAQMNKNTLSLVRKWSFSKASNLALSRYPVKIGIGTVF